MTHGEAKRAQFLLFFCVSLFHAKFRQVMSVPKRRRINGKTSAVGEGLIELEVLSMSGECMLTLNVSDSMLGRDLWKTILDKVPCKPGLQLAVFHNSRLALNESLKQQGLGGERAQVSATYIPVNLLAALRFAHGDSVEDEEFSLNGIVEVAWVSHEMPALLHNLPKSLRTLRFAHDFNQEIHRVRLPAGLQKFDFWRVLQSEPGQCDMASRPSKCHFWRLFQSQPGQRDMASRPSKFDFWLAHFNQQPGQRLMACRPSKFDFWSTVGALIRAWTT